jgi:tetratricopeptide (TPR) repeat protein
LVEEGPEAVRSDVDSLEKVPADLDEAMAWLENLSGQQGAPPQMLSLEETEYEDADEIPEDLAEAMAWLEEISVAGEGKAPRDEDESGETAPPSTVGLSEDETPGPEAVAEAEEPPEDLDEAMVWLEQLAARQGASADELPSLEEPEAELGVGADATGEIPDDLEEAIDWLKSLGDEPTASGEAAGVTAVADEGHSASESDDLAWLDDLESERAPEPEGHDDWDEAPVEAGAPDLADDLDEAIAWLEQLATEDAISFDELEGERTGQALGAEAYVGLEQLPDDPEEALAWLEGLASEPAQASIEADVVAATPTPPVPHDVVAARAEAEASIAQGEQDDAEASLPGPGEEILDEMPEDPDEAMAWLEQLAARQGASLDELPTVEEVDEEAAMPSWLAREVERARDLEDEDVSVDVAPIDDLTESDEAFLEHEFDSAVADEGEELLEELGVEFDEDFEDALPDWLVFDDEDDKVAEVEWVEPDASITSWLEAEDELAVADAERELLDVGPEDVIADEVLPEERVYEEFTAADETGAAETPTAEIGAPTSPERDLAEYEAKIEAGEELVEIIDELEGRLATQGPDALLSRMLGDAYMRNGQLQRALEAYRGALKHL